MRPTDTRLPLLLPSCILFFQEEAPHFSSPTYEGMSYMSRKKLSFLSWKPSQAVLRVWVMLPETPTSEAEENFEGCSRGF